MKIRLFTILSIITFTCSLIATLPVADRGLYALWYGQDLTILETPYITGGQIVCQWREIEPQQGKYDFSVIAERLLQLSMTGRKATLQINGNQKPEWLFSKVPSTKKRLSVQVRDEQGTLMYWHPTHREAYLNMLKRFAAFMKKSPYRDTLIGIRLNFNPIGTEHLNVPDDYKKPDAWTVPDGVDPGVTFNADVVLQYQDAVVTTFVEHISPLVKVFVRNNIKPEIEERYRHLFDSGKLGWFHTSTEAEPRSNGLEYKYIRFHKDCRSGTTVGYAEPWASAWGDHGGQEDHRPFSPPQWNYWRLLMDLHCGISYIGIYKNDLDVAVRGTYHVGDNHYIESEERLGYQREFAKAFQFAAKYVGYHNSPEESPGAWVAFRDGKEILARNAKSRNQLKLSYFTDDYNFLMERLPDATYGAHNVGPDNQRFGAWARVLPDNNKMVLKPVPEFIESLNKATVSVIYLDSNKGGDCAFVIQYGDTRKQIRLGDTGRWKIARMKVENPSDGEQIVVQSIKGKVTFHLVEMTRE